jgi:FKBP-type peptidyl-prolyl cis-trans isomerase 2
MATAQSGDRVLVHYTKRFEDGAEVSSRDRSDEPLEVTVGSPHPRLPGLGGKLAGLAPGEEITLAVPAGKAYSRPNPARVRKLARSRFPDGHVPAVGKRIRIDSRQGRSRSVRVVSVDGDVVVVDLNHPRAGQGVELSVELVAILPTSTGQPAN